jgi:hypothetical protein
MVLRSGKAVEGEGTYSTVFATARIESLPPVNLPPASDPKAAQAAQQLKYVGVLSGSVGWNAGGHAMKADELKVTGLRAPEEFYKVFQQYRHLESAYFTEAQVDEAKKRYEAKRDAINKKYLEANEQGGRQSQADFSQMMKDQGRQREQMQRQREEDCKRGPTAQQKADHEEMARIIKKNSSERYQRFVTVTEQMKKDGCSAAMQPGSPAMQHAMEMGKIMQEDPEAMAFAEKMQKRDQASRPKNTSGEAFQKNVQAMQERGPQQANEIWQTGLEYLAALDKVYSRTRITISGEKFGADGGGIVTDRAKVEDLWAKRKEKPAEDDASDSIVDSDTGGGTSGSAKPGDAAQAGKSPRPGQPPAKEPEKQDAGFNKDDAMKAGKEGFNLIKKLF